MLSPRAGVKLVKWSIDSNEPLEGEPFKGRPTYFVYYGCASDPEPWNFHIDLLVEVCDFLVLFTILYLTYFFLDFSNGTFGFQRF